MPSDVWTQWERLIGSGEAEPLDVIALAQRLHRYLEAVEKSAVKAARAGGASWQDIAEAAGTTRQSAWEKWKGMQRLTESAPDRFDSEIIALQQVTANELKARAEERRRRRNAG